MLFHKDQIFHSKYEHIIFQFKYHIVFHMDIEYFLANMRTVNYFRVFKFKYYLTKIETIYWSVQCVLIPPMYYKKLVQRNLCIINR
jgi:hypothetical protein